MALCAANNTEKSLEIWTRTQMEMIQTMTSMGLRPVRTMKVTVIVREQAAKLAMMWPIEAKTLQMVDATGKAWRLVLQTN